MKLPDHELAIVPPVKIVGYLLSASHRAGKSKAAFFGSFGFSVHKWEVMVEALRSHVRENDVSVMEETEFGVRYIIDGPLHSPDGVVLRVRSVWFVDKGGIVPRFVTAHPLRKETRND